MAQREIGLAAGEPPTAKGYTPSVFTMLARLIERAGSFASGSITGFYTVLMEGDDINDPLVDATRALLDGHVLLRPPAGGAEPISSDCNPRQYQSHHAGVVTAEHQTKANQIRRLLAVYKASEELIRIGAYQKGGDPELDRAIALMPALRSFLVQDAQEAAGMKESVERLMALPG